MGIGVNTNQPSDLSSLNSGSDINTSNQPSDSDVDNFANLLGQNSSDSGEVNVHSEPTMPSPFTQPDLEEHAVGSSWGGRYGYAAAMTAAVIMGGGGYDNGFQPQGLFDIECNPDNPTSGYPSAPEGLTDKIKDFLIQSDIIQKLNPQAQDDIAKMLDNMATGDVGPNNVIKGTLNTLIDSTDLSMHEKAVIKKVVDILCDVVATAAFIASLPESAAKLLYEDAGKVVAFADKVAHMAEGWWHDLKAVF